ncbi:unnamed protein product [Heterobilharzia americana]|nr:unnamed protein product [Heterobilharzia americana]
MVAVPCIICAKCHRIYHQYRSRKRHTKGLYAGNGCVPTATNFSSIQTKPEDASQPASSSPHHSIFVSSCRSSVVNTDFNKTVEQKADIHWLPCQEDSKHASLQKAMHRSSSVPVHCCTTASNLVITPYTP